MKKTLFVLACLLAFGSMTAENYFTMGVNDTVIIYPQEVSDFDSLAVKAHFDGRLDQWSLSITYPSGMSAIRLNRRADMYLPYMDINQNPDVLEAPLTADYNYLQISSVILDYGYYMFNDQWIPYGTVKWEAGYYGRMFDIGFSLNPNFSGGTISITGSVESSPDMRGGTIHSVDNSNTTFSRSIAVIVGYYRGDVNGDGSLTIDDVTALINYLLNPDGAGWNQYQIAAADVDGNGSIGINDVTALTNLLIHSGTNNIEELLDILSSFNQMMYSRGQGVYYAPAGIDELTGMTRHTIDNNYYNLMGQPVGKELPSTPGIYIHQGKKICVSP